MRLSLVAITLLASLFAAEALRLTGNVDADFLANQVGTVIVRDGDGEPDVVLPATVLTQARAKRAAATVAASGWDIEYIALNWDYQNDELNIGIKCFGICGDADGDGDEGATSGALSSLGGTDFANFANSEAVLVALHFEDATRAAAAANARRAFDFVIGYPGRSPRDLPALPCASANTDAASAMNNVECFGLYLYAPDDDASAIAHYSEAGGLLPHATRDANPQPNAARPHLEWTIAQLSTLLRKAGKRVPSLEGTADFALAVRAFAGSFDDDGIGEDLVERTDVLFPCAVRDTCGVCGGDDSSCRILTRAQQVAHNARRAAKRQAGETFIDCAGVENGSSEVDECEVCGGDGSTCADCNGVPNGAAEYDLCGVCGGNGRSCLDCAGEPNGQAAYDACDVCGGDDSTCADCNGVPNGATEYDECGVCGGSGASCRDCLGVANGQAVYDRCGVCAGDSTSCVDCAGELNGSAEYDECDVCGGDGTSCADCAGIPNGGAVYDACNICGGDGQSCADCAGVPFGTAEYDACDVCGGQSLECRDCNGVLNGPSRYDACDVCGGDSTTCLDCFGTPNGGATYDVCNVCGGDGTSCVDCAGVAFGSSKYDECGVCDGDSTTCLDCMGEPNGPHEYDACDVCGGDDSSCSDCRGVPYGSAEYDACDVCAGDGESCVDCEGTAFGSAVEDICGVCAGDGSSCTCVELAGIGAAEIDYALLQWSFYATLTKINTTISVLHNVQHELSAYDADANTLGAELEVYLNEALEFRAVVDNICYVSEWYKEFVDDFNESRTPTPTPSTCEVC